MWRVSRRHVSRTGNTAVSMMEREGGFCNYLRPPGGVRIHNNNNNKQQQQQQQQETVLCEWAKALVGARTMAEGVSDWEGACCCRCFQTTSRGGGGTKNALPALGHGVCVTDRCPWR
jgi:hypothetical protein